MAFSYGSFFTRWFFPLIMQFVLLILLVGYWAYNKRWALGSSDRAKAYLQGAIFLLALGFAMTYFMGLAVLDNWGHLGGALAGFAYVKLSKRPS